MKDCRLMVAGSNGWYTRAAAAERSIWKRGMSSGGQVKRVPPLRQRNHLPQGREGGRSGQQQGLGGDFALAAASGPGECGRMVFIFDGLIFPFEVME